MSYLINGTDIKNFIANGNNATSSIGNYYNSFPGNSTTESNSVAKLNPGYFTYTGGDIANNRTAAYTDFTTPNTYNLSSYAPAGTVNIKVICIGGCGGGGGAAGGKYNSNGPDQRGGYGGGGGTGGISYSGNISYNNSLIVGVGSGGNGGAGATANYNGNSGNAGNASYVGNSTTSWIINANGGGGGGGGLVAIGNSSNTGGAYTGPQGAGGGGGTGNTYNGNSGTGGARYTWNDGYQYPSVSGGFIDGYLGSSIANINTFNAGVGGQGNGGSGNGQNGLSGGGGSSGWVRVYWLPI